MSILEVIKNVKIRILKSLIISSLVPMLMLMGVAYYFNYKKTQQLLNTDLKNMTEHTASFTKYWKLRHENNLKWLTSQLSQKKYKPNDQKNILIQLKESNPDLVFAITIGPDGNTIARGDNLEFKNYAERQYFKKALAGEFVTEVVISKLLQKPIFCFAGPIKHDNKIQSVATICSFIGDLTKEIGDMKIGETGYIFLVDQNNQKFLQPNIDNIEYLKAGAETEVVSAFRAGVHNEHTFKSLHDKETYKAVVNPIGSGWAAIALQKQSEIHITALKSLITPSFIFLLILAVGGGLTYCCINRATRPLQNLSLNLRQKVIEQSQQLIYSAKMSSLGEMASGIAHEVNNPLAIISLITQDLRKKIGNNLSSQELLQQIDKIDNTSLRITKIVKGLKTFSRNGSLDPMLRENLSTILDETTALCSESLKNKGITIKIDCPAELELECQPIQLSQVFVNLIMNSKDALQHLSEKWIEIKATKANDKIFIQFTDSGMGIPVETQQKMMQPFYTTKKPGEGTGLGLSLSKGIIEYHQGNIWYNPDHPHTQFCVVLPVTQNKTIEKNSILTADYL